MTTQAKHTPGPWKAFQGDKDIVPFVASLHGEKDTICEVYSQHNGSHIANAQLIASAPALLEALQAVVAALTQPVQFTKIRNGASCDILRYDCAFAVKTARAAIQAATLNPVRL